MADRLRVQYGVEKAETMQLYFDGCQYDDKLDWYRERDFDGGYIPIRNRCPKLQENLCKAICKRMTGFLMGEQTFPKFTMPGEVDLDSLLQWLRDNVLLLHLPKALLKACIQGSVGVVFGFVRGKLRIRSYERRFCWPIFDEGDELLGIVAIYKGSNPKTGKSGYIRMTLDAVEEIWEFSENSVYSRGGNWEELNRVEHGFGFVPAIWVRHLSDGDGVDGMSLIEDVVYGGIQDELNYSQSRRSRALDYCADPQTIMKDDDPEEAQKRLIKSPHGTWLTGKEGDVSYLEIDGKGIELQGEFAQDLKKEAQELSGVILPDPDRMKGSMSGFALRMMYEPTVDLGGQLITTWKVGLQELVAKILLGARIQLASGKSVRIDGAESISQVTAQPEKMGDSVEVAHSWTTKTQWKRPVFATDVFPVSAHFGAFFDESPDEEASVINSTATAKAAGLISDETATRRVGSICGVSDVEEELRLINGEGNEEDLQI